MKASIVRVLTKKHSLKTLLKIYRYNFMWMLLHSQTIATRFWFGAASIGFASFMTLTDFAGHPGSPYNKMLVLTPDYVWGAAFLIHGLALWYGVISRKYNTLLLLLEGVLGVASWFAAASAIVIEQGAPGGTVAGAIVAFWLLVRYPTHHEWSVNRCPETDCKE